MLQAADWIGLTTLVIGIVGTALAAYWKATRKTHEGEREQLVKRIQELHLSEEDRDRLDHLTRVLGRLPDALDDHRRAIGDHGAMLRRPV